MDDDKKQLFSQILLAIAVFCVLVVLLISIIYHVQDALIDRNVFCSNITNETYDITPDHEWCKLNETTGLYEVNVTLLNTNGVST